MLHLYCSVGFVNRYRMTTPVGFEMFAAHSAAKIVFRKHLIIFSPRFRSLFFLHTFPVLIC